MSDNVISQDWIGRTLMSIHAEQRTIRSENAALREYLTTLVTDRFARSDIAFGEAAQRLATLIGESEQRLTTQLERINARLDERLPR